MAKTAKEVAEYLLFLDSKDDDTEGISNLKLQKLLYYAQGYFVALYNKNLFNEEIEAWMHGPVVPEIYREYKSHGKKSIPPPENVDINAFTTEEQEIIDDVYMVYGQFSAWALRNMTHREEPWIKRESDRDVITNNDLIDFFKDRVA